MKRVELCTGFLPEGKLRYSGQYIYKVKGYREGAHGLGEGYPQPEFFDIELEGVGGINGRLEKAKAVSAENPLDCRNHRYYLLEHDVWVKNMGDLKYYSDWSRAEVWALAVERTYNQAGEITATRELGFTIIHSDRSKGIEL